MNNEPTSDLVSIVIPCYNDEAYIGEAIESALAQTYASTEIIVVDDGSTDNSLEIIRSFGERIIWYQQENQGAPSARNHGLRKATGHYVKFLDADDVLLEDALERQVEQMQACEERAGGAEARDIVFGTGQYMTEDGNLREKATFRRPRSDEDPVAHILHVNPQTPLPLHRREALLDVDGFDERLTRAQEYDLHLRLCLAGWSLRYEPTPIALFRRHGGAERITNQNHFAADPMGKMKRIRERERVIRESDEEAFSEPVRRHLAEGIWNGGRAALRQNRPDIARKYFAYARALHAERHISGASQLYRFFVWVLGPFWAEKIAGQVREVRSLLSKS